MLNLKNTFVRDIKSTYTVAERNFSTSHDLALFILECEDSMQEITKQSGAYDEQLYNARLQSARMKVLQTTRHMCQCAHHYVCVSLSQALSRLTLSCASSVCTRTCWLKIPTAGISSKLSKNENMPGAWLRHTHVPTTSRIRHRPTRIKYVRKSWASCRPLHPA